MEDKIYYWAFECGNEIASSVFAEEFVYPEMRIHWGGLEPKLLEVSTSKTGKTTRVLDSILAIVDEKGFWLGSCLIKNTKKLSENHIVHEISSHGYVAFSKENNAADIIRNKRIENDKWKKEIDEQKAHEDKWWKEHLERNNTCR